MTAFIGVRISWLIAARNALFAWFAVRVTAGGVELGDVVVDRVVAELLAVDHEGHHQDLGVDDRAVLAHPLADLVGPTLASRLAGEVVGERRAGPVR